MFKNYKINSVEHMGAGVSTKQVKCAEICVFQFRDKQQNFEQVGDQKEKHD